MVDLLQCSPLDEVTGSEESGYHGELYHGAIDSNCRACAVLAGMFFLPACASAPSTTDVSDLQDQTVEPVDQRHETGIESRCSDLMSL